MTKQEFVNEVARRADLSSRDAAKAVDAFLDAITDTLQGGGEVAFHLILRSRDDLLRVTRMPWVVATQSRRTGLIA